VGPCFLVHPALAGDCYRALHGPAVFQPPYHPTVVHRRQPQHYIYPQVHESTFYFS
jgi:hypothetical protein